MLFKDTDQTVIKILLVYKIKYLIIILNISYTSQALLLKSIYSE